MYTYKNWFDFYFTNFVFSAGSWTYDDSLIFIMFPIGVMNTMDIFVASLWSQSTVILNNSSSFIFGVAVFCEPIILL